MSLNAFLQKIRIGLPNAGYEDFESDIVTAITKIYNDVIDSNTEASGQVEQLFNNIINDSANEYFIGFRDNDAVNARSTVLVDGEEKPARIVLIDPVWVENELRHINAQGESRNFGLEAILAHELWHAFFDRPDPSEILAFSSPSASKGGAVEIENIVQAALGGTSGSPIGPVQRLQILSNLGTILTRSKLIATTLRST